MTGSSLATMSRQLSLSLNLLSFLVIYSTLAACAQTNRTIDDQFGDQVTALVPVYSPATAWKQGANCTDCLVNPLVSQAFKGTWHQGLHTAGDVESTVVTVSFRGTAVYAYCVLANTISYSNTPTNLNFRLNNTIVGTFVHTPDASTTFIYNVPVYVNTSIPNGLHTFEIEATGNTSLVMFDYLTYTFEDGVLPPTSSQQSSSYVLRGSLSRDMTPAIIVGIVMGGLVVLALLALGVFLLIRRYRHRNIEPIIRSNSRRKNILSDTPPLTPEMRYALTNAQTPSGVTIQSSYTSMERMNSAMESAPLIESSEWVQINLHSDVPAPAATPQVQAAPIIPQEDASPRLEKRRQATIQLKRKRYGQRPREESDASVVSLLRPVSLRRPSFPTPTGIFSPSDGVVVHPELQQSFFDSDLPRSRQESTISMTEMGQGPLCDPSYPSPPYTREPSFPVSSADIPAGSHVVTPLPRGRKSGRTRSDASSSRLLRHGTIDGPPLPNQQACAESSSEHGPCEQCTTSPQRFGPRPRGWSDASATTTTTTTTVIPHTTPSATIPAQRHRRPRSAVSIASFIQSPPHALSPVTELSSPASSRRAHSGRSIPPVPTLQVRNRRYSDISSSTGSSQPTIREPRPRGYSDATTTFSGNRISIVDPEVINQIEELRMEVERLKREQRNLLIEMSQAPPPSYEASASSSTSSRSRTSSAASYSQ